MFHTEDDFQNHLDAHPDDGVARQVFADWLEENGDPRAAGYRALGEMGLAPIAYDLDPDCGELWLYHCGVRAYPRFAKDYNQLSPAWLALVANAKKNDQDGAWKHALWCGYYPTRRQTEDAAALAFRPEFAAVGG